MNISIENRILFEDAIANASGSIMPMPLKLDDQRRKAMFARLQATGRGGGRVARSQPSVQGPVGSAVPYVETKLPHAADASPEAIKLALEAHGTPGMIVVRPTTTGGSNDPSEPATQEHAAPQKTDAAPTPEPDAKPDESTPAPTGDGNIDGLSAEEATRIFGPGYNYNQQMNASQAAANGYVYGGSTNPKTGGPTWVKDPNWTPAVQEIDLALETIRRRGITADKNGAPLQVHPDQSNTPWGFTRVVVPPIDDQVTHLPGVLTRTDEIFSFAPGVAGSIQWKNAVRQAAREGDERAIATVARYGLSMQESMRNRSTSDDTHIPNRYDPPAWAGSAGAPEL